MVTQLGEGSIAS